MVLNGQKKYGFTPVVIDENGKIPFEDLYFDIVFCSSVIEHVTIPKSQVWNTKDQKQFKKTALERQYNFAKEINRLGKTYFVQTPNRWFPIETHTWLPFVSYLPRKILLPFLKLSNRFWIKKTTPDWNLLSKSEFQYLFPDAKIITEKFFGFTKSLIAIKKS